eukprot:5043196-Pyramimonas_sp.AAC.1
MPSTLLAGDVAPVGAQRIYTTTTSIPYLSPTLLFPSSFLGEGGVEGGGGGVYFWAPRLGR